MVSDSIRRAPTTSRTTRATRIEIPGWLNWEQKQLHDALALAGAREAGRAAQVAALETALRSCAPDHELLAETGSSNADGTPELRWHAVFDAPHDAIAVLHGFMSLGVPARFMRGGYRSDLPDTRRERLRDRSFWAVLSRFRSLAERD